MRNSFRRNSKGVSTIFGMVFFLLIVVLVIASFMVVLNQSTMLEATMIQTREMDNEKARELIVLEGISGDYGHMVYRIKNYGSSTVEIVRSWTEDTDTSAFSSKELTNIFIEPNEEIAVPAPDNANPDLKCWVVTARGNQFTLKPPVGTQGEPGESGVDGTRWIPGTGYTHTNTPPNDKPPVDVIDPFTMEVAKDYDYFLNDNSDGSYDLFQKINGAWWFLVTLRGAHTTYANVAGGIGFIAMDFEVFEHWEFTSARQTGDVIDFTGPNGPKTSSEYTIQNPDYVLFHVKLANVDPDNMIQLTSKSAIYTLGSQGGTVKFVFWNIVEVDPVTHRINLTPGASNVNLQLPRYADHSEPPVFKDVWFYAQYPSINLDVPQVYPMNIMLYGLRGTHQYGQNLPFVSIDLRTS